MAEALDVQGIHMLPKVLNNATVTVIVKRILYMDCIRI